jgi:hypothetical protein
VLLTFLKKGQQATVLQLPASAGVSHPLSADEPRAAVSRRERLPGQISAISR